MTVFPLLEGLAATLVAVLIVAGWLALGVLAFGDTPDDDDAAIPVRLLAGSGATAFLIAVAAYAGVVAEGLIAVAALCSTALALRGRRVVAMIRGVVNSYRAITSSRFLACILAAAALIGWISAIAPPRSADAMRYHLAHVRLILLEGRWSPIQDFHFALPFGWSLSYLPFEMIGLPQGAQILSFVLFILLGAVIIGCLSRLGTGRIGAAAAFLMLLHPFVVRTFSEASADPYSIFAVLAVALLLMRLPALRPSEAVAFGFVTWIGIQSRYQLVAVGIAATATLLFAVRHAGDRASTLLRVGAGALAACVLASPFYIVNARAFGNPVWPLLISQQEAELSYADRIAWHFGRSLTGPRTLSHMLESVWDLISWPRLFPLALVIVLGVVILTRTDKPELKRLGWFGIAFLILWLFMQPGLYPRFVLLMLPVAALYVGYGAGAHYRAGRWASRTILVAMATMVGVSAALSREAFAFAATGGEAKYHEHTWFYPVWKWVNSHTPENSRVLTVVSSGMTYYLERPYRRADPWIGGEIDWPGLRNGAELHGILMRGGFTHVVYETRDWENFSGGEEMQAHVADAIDRGLFIPIRRFNVRLYRSRATRTYRSAPVTIYRVSSPASTGN